MESISVIMPTFNSVRTINHCLSSLREQDYDQKKIEIIAIDGGSTDGTKKLLQKYHCKIVSDQSGSPESAKAKGLQHARGELILLIASDNILPSKNWLREMVRNLLKEPKAVAAYPWHYAYRSADTGLNRYFALMGVNDPVAWWLGRQDRQGYGSDQWKLSGEAQDKGDYWLVRFTLKDMPTLGDNGVLIWKKTLLKAKVDEQNFSHIDVFWDLVSLGLNRFVVVKNEIVHDTGKSLASFLGKRFKYLQTLYLKQLKMRRYQWVRNYSDTVKLGLFVIYSFSVIGPLLTAINGWRKKPDRAWFWQMILAPAVTIVYSWGLIL